MMTVGLEIIVAVLHVETLQRLPKHRADSDSWASCFFIYVKRDIFWRGFGGNRRSGTVRYSTIIINHDIPPITHSI